MRPLPLLTLPLVAAALAAAAPASAVTISPAGVRFPQLAVNSDGATAVAWERASKGSFAIEARGGARPTALARTQRLSAHGFGPRVAVGEDGTMAVMWMEYGAKRTRAVRVAIARPGHRFGRAHDLHRRSASLAPVAVAVQPNGRVVAIYQHSANAASVALARKGHGFGRPRSLGAKVGQVVSDPRDGSVVVLQSSTVAPGGTQPGAVSTLSPKASSFSSPLPGPFAGAGLANLSSLGPVLVAGPGGVAAVTTALGSDATAVAFTRRAANGAWAAPQLVAMLPFVDGTYVEGLAAALPADGCAVAAWSLVTEVPGGLGGKLAGRSFASIAPPSGVFGAPQALTPDGSHTFGFPAAVAGGDEAFVASAEPHGSVLVSARSAGASALDAPATLTTAGDGDVVLAAGGRHVLAAYQQHDRLRLEIVR